jgi:ABC-type Fe3+ transport system permease subunit
MLFDAGENATAWTIFIAIWACPLMLLLGMTIAWIAFAARAYWLIWAAGVIAVLPIVVLAGGFILAS